MTDDYKMKIEQKINDKPNLKAMAFFLSGNSLVHAMSLDGGVGVDVGFYMYDYIRNNVGDADAKDFAIKLYGVAMCFDAADEYWDNNMEKIRNILNLCKQYDEIDKQKMIDTICNTTYNTSRRYIKCQNGIN